MGASSFSGRHFADAISEAGEQVLCLSRGAGYDLNSGLPLIMRDVFAFEPDYFVNFAALNVVADSWKHAADYYQTNVVGVGRLAEELRKWGGLKKFVQVSTPEIYGAGNDAYRKLPEWAPAYPSTPYAASRAAADVYLGLLKKQWGFPVVFTRTVNVYGIRQQPYRIIPKTTLSILRGLKLPLDGGGASTRSFIHIRDVALGTKLVAEHGEVGEVYHMATERQTSIRNLVRMICDRMGAKFDDVVVEAPERPGKDKAYDLSWGLIQRLGWKPTIELEDGLAEAVDWFVQHQSEFQSLVYEHRA